ncbi:hypothetical protein BIZ70_gp072 [Gordonia phage JSwag]|uniref:hypothetical protein n=1 Tax=Gordonia phage JSwag TaxID=1887649 RepID=UPI00084F1DA4|nr:hypothetical protein BIZ70_gp072 [Gordonia phage JSwag]AOE44451.1 hypothetical protein SEA_JSWAG_41 [Gordonia phage JSwag]
MAVRYYDKDWNEVEEPAEVSDFFYEEDDYFDGSLDCGCCSCCGCMCDDWDDFEYDEDDDLDYPEGRD